jgi:hypothetical protein
VEKLAPALTELRDFHGTDIAPIDLRPLARRAADPAPTVVGEYTKSVSIIRFRVICRWEETLERGGKSHGSTRCRGRSEHPRSFSTGQQTLMAPLEVADGDLVRCAIAPYLFRARTTGGALLLEPVGDQSRNLAPPFKVTVPRSGHPSK